MVITTDWHNALSDCLSQPYWTELESFVAEERATHTVYPPADKVFAAFELTALADVKVVILGQDPYHGPGQAEGLAFSVRHPTRTPPSLRNIFKELAADLGIEPPNHGSLHDWASQGVLLLNTTLTVRDGQAGSHHGHGWELFSDQVIRVVNDNPNPVVFVLWGTAARAKEVLVDPSRHRVISAAHPSPLSAHRGFFGSCPFSRTNDALRQLGRDPVDWRLSNR